MESIRYRHNEAAARKVAEFYPEPPLAFVHSYGCQQNVADGEKIKGVLMDIGYGLCDSPEHADLILFNTCAVREHAEQRVFGNVVALKKYKQAKTSPASHRLQQSLYRPQYTESHPGRYFSSSACFSSYI